MRQLPNESYEQWIERVRIFELNYARKQIADGADINLVIEAMSSKIMKKLMHPVILAIKDSSNKEYDFKAEKEAYFEKMKNWKPPADHVDGQKFDKSE